MKMKIVLATLIVPTVLLSPGELSKSGARLEMDGVEIVRAMNDRYSDSWYSDLTFVQRTTFFDRMSSRIDSVQLWYESVSPGGRLRIDIAPLDAGNSLIFRNDSLYGFRDYERAFAVPIVHFLLVLAFDVYKQVPEEIVAKLTTLGFDLGKVYEAQWLGREVYVVGAESAEDKSDQFWIDKERMVFVRSLRYGSNGNEQEVRFNKYEPIGGGWIAPEVVFLLDGEVTLVEEYRNYSTSLSLGDNIFDVDSLIRLPWVKN